ncbi:MAG TPA: hypothetical protein VF502_02140 [Stellaceae bacterium]
MFPVTMDAATDLRRSPPPPEGAGELLAALRRLVTDGKVEIRIVPRTLNHIDSPVTVEADGNIWAYAFLFIAALLWWRWGAAPGLAAVAAGVAVYLTLGRAYVHRRIERRVREQALYDIGKWRKLWQFSGLTLVATGRPDIAACASPKDNWMAFIRDLK